MFEQYGYALIPSTSLSTAFVFSLLEVDVALDSSQSISGNVRQYDLLKAAAFTDKLQVAWKDLVFTTTASVGLSAALSTTHRLTSPKLLVASPHQGLQAIHWDDATAYQGGQSKLTFILYCSSGTYSTAMPRFPPHLLHWAPEEEDIPAMQLQSYLLDYKYFHSVLVKSGDMMVFWQNTPHFGVQNRCSLNNRITLFSMLTPTIRSETTDDEYQFFRWMYMAEAFGDTSREFALALVDDKHQNPLGRYEEEDYEQAIDCLKRHGLYQSYFGHNKAVTWKQLHS
jgi:hypothetical protein